MHTQTDINRRTVQRFLTGTHSRNIEDVAVIDETVADTITCHGFPGFVIEDHESYKNFFSGSSGSPFPIWTGRCMR
ncbi:hypothetical protein QW131_15520 [Roseibium salinum]|nr:hypothetical protein [Roseibium salinum]